MKLPKQPNQSLIDGIACLQELAICDEPLGVRELGRRLGMEPTRVHRFLRSLAHVGMVAQTPDRRYMTGPGMHILSIQSLHASGLMRAAFDTLSALGRYGHKVALGVLWRDHVCYLYHAEAGMKSSEAIGRMSAYPAWLSGLGVAMLARNPENEVREMYRKHFKDPEEEKGFIEKLRHTRERGYAAVRTTQSPEEKDCHETVAVTFSDPELGAIGFSDRVEAGLSQRDEVVEILRRAAHEIERKYHDHLQNTGDTGDLNKSIRELSGDVYAAKKPARGNFSGQPKGGEDPERSSIERTLQR